MRKKWLWTNIVLISVLVVLLFVLTLSNPKQQKNPPPNYWLSFKDVANNDNATLDELNSAFKAACPKFESCEPSNTLWYIIRARSRYNVKPATIMSKENVKKLTDFYEKNYANDKYQSSFIPMFPLELDYMNKEDAYQWLIKLGNYKAEDFELHMAQIKSVWHIFNFLNISYVTELKNPLGDKYNTFYNNVCWNQMREFSVPSKESYFYLAYKKLCKLPLKDELNTFKQMSEKNYSNAEEKRMAGYIGRLLNTIE